MVDSCEYLKESGIEEIQYIPEESIFTVLNKVRDEVHKGHVLLTHPLSGSIKPFETPYKSVLITCNGSSLDFSSLQWIEDAILKAKSFEQSDYFQGRMLTEKIKKDFQLIDYHLILSGIASYLQAN